MIIILNNRRITKAAANKKRNTQAKNTNTKTIKNMTSLEEP
jgi:hypothetical protein